MLGVYSSRLRSYESKGVCNVSRFAIYYIRAFKGKFRPYRGPVSCTSFDKSQSTKGRFPHRYIGTIQIPVRASERFVQERTATACRLDIRSAGHQLADATHRYADPERPLNVLSFSQLSGCGIINPTQEILTNKLSAAIFLYAFPFKRAESADSEDSRRHLRKCISRRRIILFAPSKLLSSRFAITDLSSR